MPALGKGLQQHLVLVRGSPNGRAGVSSHSRTSFGSTSASGPASDIRSRARLAGQEGREGELRSAPGRHLGVLSGSRRDQDVHAALTPTRRQTLSGEDEGVARLQDVEIALLDLADLSAPFGVLAEAAPRRPPAPLSMAGETIAPMFIRWRRAISALRTFHRPSAALHDAREAVIGAQGVAAGGDEVDHGLEVLPRSATAIRTRRRRTSS